jgi:hypothetical protein
MKCIKKTIRTDKKPPNKVPKTQINALLGEDLISGIIAGSITLNR